MSKTKEQLLASAEEIRTNTAPNSNTADLVGSTLKDMINKSSDDKDELQNNIDELSEGSSEVISSVRSDLSSEVARAKAAENAAAAAVTAEETRAKAAESALNTSLTGVKSDMNTLSLVNDGVKYAGLIGIDDDTNKYAANAVPTDKRKVGLIVTYLDKNGNPQTYQFTGSNISQWLTITNWQGIDDKPTANSDNLVKSGGVYAKIKVLEDAGYVFAGVATPTTNPGTPDGPVFYLASESGTYTNFNAIELQDGLSVLMWNGSWSSQQIFSVDDVPTAGSSNLVKSHGIARQYGTYIENENYVYAKLDSEGKILFAIDREGNIIFGAGIPPQIKQAIDELKELSEHYIHSSKYIKVITDSDNKILQYFNSKGIVNFPAGIESPTIDSLKGNILNGKKYAFCGDSFTEAIFSGITDSEGRIGMDSPELYDSVRRMWKSYGWWVIDRNNMKYYADGVSGSRMTAIYDGGVIQNPNAFCNQRYMNVPKDSDYITLMFGLNETSVSIGDENSTDDSTLWGAYNKVLEYFLTEMPYAKVGIIISDAWMVGTNIATTIKNIAKYWGIPYLDLGGDDRVSMRIGGKSYPVSQTAKSLRNAAFQISPSDSHPNQYGHKYMSSIVENFLRTL